MRLTGFSASLLIALLPAVPIACRSPAPTRVPAYELRERHGEIRVGESLEDVHARMGELPVPRPGHPDAPFPTPYRSTTFRTPGGDTVRLEVYVVAVRPAEGCPDVQYEDAPVAYLNRRVAALSWDDLEWRWREWGGDLGVLRALQDRFVCERGGLPESPEAAPAAPSGGPGAGQERDAACRRDDVPGGDSPRHAIPRFLYSRAFPTS